jgi:hypothetical protein
MVGSESHKLNAGKMNVRGLLGHMRNIREKPGHPNPGRVQSLLRGAVLVAVIASWQPGTAVAQLPSLPVYYRPIHDPYPVVSFQADYGLGLADISEYQLVAAQVALEGESMRGVVGLGTLIPDEGNGELAIAASVAFNLRGPITVTVIDAQLGVGYFELGDRGTGELKQLDIPAGVGVGLQGKLPLAHLSNVEPWLALRGHLRYSELTDSASTRVAWRGGGGVSGGFNVLFPSGIGIQIAADWLVIREPVVAAWSHEVALGFGVHFRS